MKRFLSILLVFCLLLGMIPAFVSHVEVEVSAVSGVDSLTCGGFISNSTRRNYIDTMMKYYINSYSKLQTALNSGKSVVFMFEGGSDHYDSYPYVDGSYQTRLQAVCIVVQMNSSGNAQIVFYSENCSSIPDDANYVTPGYETSGSTTILDGIYSMTTVNHNGNYAAHTTDCYTGWYTPYAGSTGYSAACNGINIHTRSTSYNLTYGGQSMGCQLIGYGANSSNEYNQFMKTVAGISFNAFDGTQRTMSATGVSKGYYVIDRQLGLLSPDGTEYGTGSLTALYTKADLTGITKFSTAARANANFDYTSKCTFYSSYCQFTTTKSTPINSQPCSAGNNSSETLETAAIGATYTAIGMYQNTGSNFWYQVKTSSGETGYIYAGHTTYVKQLISDVKLSSGATYPNGVVAGKYFVVNGTISSTYNTLKSVAVYVHQGFGTSGTKKTGASASVNGKSYTLDSSSIDNNTAFDALSAGKYTYVISADYLNYYAKSAQELGTNTGTKYLMTEYFMVIPSSVSQSSCSHSYTTTTVTAATCTTSGIQVKSCATCGLISKETIATTGHSYGDWSVTNATCTADGSKTHTCTACGNVETQSISTTGHNYYVVTHAATCQSYTVYEYTCGTCGDHYTLSADALATDWIDFLPAGLDSSLFKSKTQYRYSDYETITSYEPTLDGYNLKSSQWVQSGSGTINYVSSWPSGFSTSNSLYSQYNNKSSKVSASETATTKTTVVSDNVVGYLYYHWCYSNSIYSVASSSGSYKTFHAYYSTTNPSNYTCDTSDMSYKASHSCCSNSPWFFVTEVYAQEYATYNKLFTFERWTDFTDWSDTAVTATSIRNVENRTVYQLKEAALANHSWSEGACGTCGEVCGHSYVSGTCNVCGMAEPPQIVVPTISLAYPSLNFESEVMYNIYYNVDNLTDVVEMGLITFDSYLANGTIDDAAEVIPGYTMVGSTYMSHTNGIPAKMLGDAMYFRTYAKLSDGTYVYSQAAGYHAVAYAKDMLANSSNDRMKALVVAMLNYGAAAQVHFEYKTDSLMNAFLTDEQKALVEDYSADMVAGLTAVNSSKVGTFKAVSGGYSALAPSVVFDGAFAINYYFTPAKAVDGELTLYYWTLDDYNAATVLTTDNATGKVIMQPAGVEGKYLGAVEGIAAKEIDRTVLVSGVYESGGVRYCTGVIAYSLAAYCQDRIAKGSETMQAVAMKTAVYGYYAKDYFANL